MSITTKSDSAGRHSVSGIERPALAVAQGAQPSASSDVTGKLAVIQRPDGSSQVTINDMPLYYYKNDAQPGDTKGQGVGNNWYVVSPAGTMITTGLQ